MKNGVFFDCRVGGWLVYLYGGWMDEIEWKNGVVIVRPKGRVIVRRQAG